MGFQVHEYNDYNYNIINILGLARCFQQRWLSGGF